MSRETKLGLLISLGVILAFAMIISIHLGNDNHADLESAGGESHLGQYEQLARTGDAGDALDRETAEQQTSDGLGETGVPAESPVVDGADDSRVILAYGPGSEENLTGVEQGNNPPAEELQTPQGDSGRDAPAAPQQTYKVKSGDRLFAIAEKFYGSGKGHKWTLIRDANPGIDPNRLKVNDVLTIPPLEPQTRLAENPSPAPLENTIGNGGGREAATVVHHVAQGDTLGDISTKYYGTCRKWQLIVDANPGLNPRSLKVGSKLVIPQVEPAPSSAPAPSRPSRPTFDEVEDTRTVERALEEVQRFVDDRAVESPHSPYTVASGDTLWSISQKQFGDSKRWKEIYELNRDKLSSPGAVRVGQVLRIPATTTTAMMGAGGAN